MKRKIGRYTKAFLALALAVFMVLELGGLQGLASLLTASTQAEEEYLGVPFPSDFSADSVESDYYLSTAEEFVRFAAASRSYGFAGVTIHLAGDIDYSDGYAGVSFAGIGSSDTPFCGTFEGHGHTIRNLYSTSTGMFHIVGSTENPVTIRNFTLDSAAISGAEGRAVLVSRFSGNAQDETANNLIENVTVSNSTGSFTGNNCGILVGRCLADDQAITVSGCAVTDCSLICTAASETNVNQWGIIIGKDRSLGYSRILNCTVTGSNIISTDCNLDKTGLVAGLVYGPAKIDGCTVMTSSIRTGLASDTVTQELGGIVGCLQSGYGTITNCTVATTGITTAGACRYVGLLAGHLYGGTVQNNTVTQSRIRADYAGAEAQSVSALVGYLSGSAATVQDCQTSRIIMDLAGRANAVGGLIGSIDAASAGTVIRDSCAAHTYMTVDCVSDTASTYLGGAVGVAFGQVTAENVLVGNMNITAGGLVQYAGLLAGRLCGGTVEGCAVNGSRFDLTYNVSGAQASRIGGLIGCVSDSAAKILDSGVRDVTISNASRVNSIGGMIGNIESASAGTIIRDSSVTGLKLYNTYSTNSSSSFYIGGVIGRALGKVHITNVDLTDGEITAASLVQGMGGFGGYITGSDPSVLSECDVSGVTVTQTQASLNDDYKCYHVAGFLGCVDSDSKLAGCTVTDTGVTLQGRVYYLGGLIGSTYSDAIQTTPVSAMVTVKNCAVENVSLATTQSRNCNEFGGLIGWLSEGGTVTNCYVSGVTNPSNTNSVHVGGLIGYVAESTTEAVNTTVKNCYVENCGLNGKTSISATIGNAVASGEVFTNNYYYNCTLIGGTESNASSASQVTTTANLTDGTLVTSLNTTAGAGASTGSWAQGTASPILNPGREGYTEAKVMSFNIYYLAQNSTYPISDRQSKVIDLIDAAYDSGVGVFGLQEVSGIWYDYINDYVKNENPNLVWSGYGRYGGTFGGFGSGTNATNDQFPLILYDKTRYDKTDEGHFWLSDTPSEKSLFYSVAYNYRVVNWVRLRDKTTGEEFVFVNAHLEETRTTAAVNDWGYTIDASCGPVARIKQAQLICDQMEAYADGLPVIIVGDWNSYAGTDGYSTIIDNGYQDIMNIAELADVCGSYNAWTRTDTSKFAFGDHITASELCTAIAYEVLAEEDKDSATGYHLSDHSPLVATIRY